MTITKLIKLARTTAVNWLECDDALAAVNETWGLAYEAARTKLNQQLLEAPTLGIDLEQFKGKKSPFIFPDEGVRVVPRVFTLPVPNDALAKADARIKRCEMALKLAKNKKKELVEELQIKGHEFHVSQVVTTFQRIKK